MGNPKIEVINSIRELTIKVNEIKSGLSRLEIYWNERIEAIKRIESLVRGGATEYRVFSSLFKNELMDLILKQLLDRRSIVIEQVCNLLCFLASQKNIAFEMIGEIFFPALIKLVVVTVQAIANSGNNCIKKILLHCKLNRLLPILLDKGINDRSTIVRQRCSEYVCLILSKRSNDIKSFSKLFENYIKKCAMDAVENVRKNARVCYFEYSVIWQKNSNSLFSSFNSNVQKMIKEEKQLHEERRNASSFLDLNKEEEEEDMDEKEEEKGKEMGEKETEMEVNQQKPFTSMTGHPFSSNACEDLLKKFKQIKIKEDESKVGAHSKLLTKPKLKPNPKPKLPAKTLCSPKKTVFVKKLSPRKTSLVKKASPKKVSQKCFPAPKRVSLSQNLARDKKNSTTQILKPRNSFFKPVSPLKPIPKNLDVNVNVNVDSNVNAEHNVENLVVVKELKPSFSKRSSFLPSTDLCSEENVNCIPVERKSIIFPKRLSLRRKSNLVFSQVPNLQSGVEKENVFESRLFDSFLGSRKSFRGDSGLDVKSKDEMKGAMEDGREGEGDNVFCMESNSNNVQEMQNEIQILRFINPNENQELKLPWANKARRSSQTGLGVQEMPSQTSIVPNLNPRSFALEAREKSRVRESGRGVEGSNIPRFQFPTNFFRNSNLLPCRVAIDSGDSREVVMAKPNEENYMKNSKSNLRRGSDISVGKFTRNMNAAESQVLLNSDSHLHSNFSMMDSSMMDDNKVKPSVSSIFISKPRVMRLSYMDR